MDNSDWHCHRCGQPFRSFDVPSLVPTESGNQFVHPGECPPCECGHIENFHRRYQPGFDARVCIREGCDCQGFVSLT